MLPRSPQRPKVGSLRPRLGAAPSPHTRSRDCNTTTPTVPIPTLAKTISTRFTFATWQSPAVEQHSAASERAAQPHMRCTAHYPGMISPQALVLAFQVVEEQCIFVRFRSDHRREQMELVRQRAERVVLKKPVAGSHIHTGMMTIGSWGRT